MGQPGARLLVDGTAGKVTGQCQRSHAAEPEGQIRLCQPRRRLRTLGRYDEAKTIIDQAAAQGLGSPSDFFSLYTMAFDAGDKAGMQRAMELAKGVSVEPIMLLIEGPGAMRFGQDTDVPGKALPRGSA